MRSAAPDDELAVARVHVRSWQAAYRGLLPDAYLDQLRPEDRAARYTFGDADPSKPATIVAVMDGDIRGFATTVPARDTATQGRGELAGLYVDPDFWGKGLGEMLLREAERRLQSRGFAEAILWVLEGNQRAQRFYEKHGWHPAGAARSETIWEVAVRECRYGKALA